MCASLERMFDVLAWLETKGGHQRVGVCHPTTSSGPGETDIVLVDEHDERTMLIEVCDVVSSKDGNNKELRTLKALGCEVAWPIDSAERLVATTPEFASWLRRTRRSGARCSYEPVFERTGQTTVLRVSPR